MQYRIQKILIVQPEHVIRSILCQKIIDNAAKESFEIYEAETNNAAIKLLNSLHPDLIIIAYDTPPEIIKLIKIIRQQDGLRHTGIICAFPTLEYRLDTPVDCLQSGADDFISPKCMPQEFMARVRAVLSLKSTTDELRSANHRLRILSMTDELTGLANMRHFEQKFRHLTSECEAGKHGIGLIMLDLDHFKSVNDTTNHLVGSYVISEVGKLIKKSRLFNGSDVAARYGGDEYIIATASTDFADIKKRAESICKLIREAEFVKGAIKIKITSSVGASWAPPKFTGIHEDIIKSADLMLYKSKENGRNQVTAHDMSTDCNNLFTDNQLKKSS